MFHTYEEACEAEVTRQQAAAEVQRHHCDPAEFFAEVGDRPNYPGQVVLDWLGY